MPAPVSRVFLRLSDFTPQEIAKWRQLHEQHGVTFPAIAKRYGVSVETVRKAFKQMREAANAS